MCFPFNNNMWSFHFCWAKSELCCQSNYIISIFLEPWNEIRIKPIKIYLSSPHFPHSIWVNPLTGEKWKNETKTNTINLWSCLLEFGLKARLCLYCSCFCVLFRSGVQPDSQQAPELHSLTRQDFHLPPLMRPELDFLRVTGPPELQNLACRWDTCFKV